jgi:hypothetical protein
MTDTLRGNVNNSGLHFIALCRGFFMGGTACLQAVAFAPGKTHGWASQPCHPGSKVSQMIRKHSVKTRKK